MKIDESITELEKARDSIEPCLFIDEALDQSMKTAIETMRKYQKIEEILDSASYIENGIVYSYTYDNDTRIKHIRKVIKDES